MGDWSANRWPLLQHLVKCDHRKMAGDENLANQEEDRRVSRDCRILNHRQIHLLCHRIQGVPWLKGLIRRESEQRLGRRLTWFCNTDSNVSAGKILEEA